MIASFPRKKLLPRLIAPYGSDGFGADIAGWFVFAESRNLEAIITEAMAAGKGFVRDVDSIGANGAFGSISLRIGISIRGRWSETNEREGGIGEPLGSASNALQGHHRQDEKHEFGESIPHHLIIHEFEANEASSLSAKINLFHAEKAMDEADVGAIPQKGQKVEYAEQLIQFLDAVNAAQDGRIRGRIRLFFLHVFHP